MVKAYLTIDDGPSAMTMQMVDFLESHKIPAILFNRGDRMAEDPDSVINAIQKGFVIGNHGWSHQRASVIDFADVCDEIQKTDALIEQLYEKAGVMRPAKYFRFPYMDRGMGAYFSDPNTLLDDDLQAHLHLLRYGLGHVPEVPGFCLIDKKNKLQDYLRELGYVPVPFENVTLPWYAETEMARSIDALCTFSTSDWALTERHKGKHGFESIRDLKQQIDQDRWLHDSGSHHIILMHDQDELLPVFTGLIDYFLLSGVEFLDFGPDN